MEVSKHKILYEGSKTQCSVINQSFKFTILNRDFKIFVNYKRIKNFQLLINFLNS